MATAFQTEFVIISDCELLGKTPSDQDDALSQLPLPGVIQEFTCAKTDVEVNALAERTKHSACRVQSLRYVELRIVVRSSSPSRTMLRRTGNGYSE